MDTITRSIPNASRSGFRAISMMMAEQLGLAMIPPSAPPFPDWRAARVFFHASSIGLTAASLTSGTTRGTPSSMRKAEELSMTMVPALAAAGPYCFEIPLPAEKRAMSTPRRDSGVSSVTRTFPPR